VTRRWPALSLGTLLLGGCGERAPVVHFDPGSVPAEHEAGRQRFDASCARCHGRFAVGTEAGPPLVHRYYEPSHHADEAFRRAIRFGVQPHHWGYGPMPAVAGLTGAQADDIIAYIRWLQRRAGVS
jgi:mono/diheme cytochrome c family protein